MQCNLQLTFRYANGSPKKMAREFPVAIAVTSKDGQMVIAALSSVRSQEPMQSIANKFNVNAGRVSEVIRDLKL